jgi:hypothetical protein
MGVKITNREYSELNSNDNTNWLLGNVGDWQTLKLECEVNIEYYGTQENSIFIDPFLKTFKLNNGKNWSDLGFDIGQAATYRFHFFDQGIWDIDLSTTFTILAVNGDIMEVSNMNLDTIPPGWQGSALSSETHPFNKGASYIDEVRMLVDTEPEGLKLTYAHVTNDDVENNSLNSLIDGTTTSFVLPNIKSVPIGASVNAGPIGFQSGMGVRQVRAVRLGKKAGTINTYLYEVYVNYLNCFFFDNPSDIINRKIPNYLIGENSLTDNFSLIFYPVWNNPNTKISNDPSKTKRLGNTG